MSNPVFNNSPIFSDPARRPRTGANAQGGVLDTRAGAAPAMDTASLDALYQAPSATARDTGRMTYDDVIMRTGGMLAVVVVAAAVGWYLVPSAPWLVWAGALVGLGLGLANAFRRQPSPALIMSYAVAEGVFLGGISYLFQNIVVPSANGGTAAPIVLQAVLATFATFAAALALFRSGKVRVTPKFVRWLLVAMVGYLVFSLVNVVLMFFMPSGDFGPLRGGFIGVLVGLVAVGLAAASLIVDFDAIKRGVEQGVPARFAWQAAFGLVVTLVWLYLEFLRLLAILQGRD